MWMHVDESNKHRASHARLRALGQLDIQFYRGGWRSSSTLHHVRNGDVKRVRAWTEFLPMVKTKIILKRS